MPNSTVAHGSYCLGGANMSSNARVVSTLCISLLVASARLQAQSYHELTEYKLASAPASGIAVDSGSRKLFVGTADGIAVLNADTGASVGNIAGLTHTHDVLLLPPAEGEEHPQQPTM